MYSVRRDRERNRPWRWNDQEVVFSTFIERIKWAQGFSARVDLRALATRSHAKDDFAFAYVHAHVRPFDCEEPMEDTSLSFRYPTAWFEREVLSIDEFLARVDSAQLSQTARLRSVERQLGRFRVGQLEAALQTDGDTDAWSDAGLSRAALYPSWSWWVRLVSARPTTPLVSYSSGAPFFETALDLIGDFGGMRWFPDNDIRVGAFNIVVSDPRGVILGVEQGTEPSLDELRVSTRWSGPQSAGTLSAIATPEIELTAMEGPVSVNAALVAEHDELVDVTNFEIVPAPSMPEILELIRRGESALLEFKEWIRLGDQKIHNLEKCVVAMANGSEVGVILLGVDDYGEMKWERFLYDLIADGDQVPSQFERRRVAAQRYGVRLRDALLTKISPGPVIEMQVVGCEPDVVLRMDVFGITCSATCATRSVYRIHGISRGAKSIEPRIGAGRSVRPQPPSVSQSSVRCAMMRPMRLATILLTITIAACAHDPDAPCIGGGCTETRPDRSQPGSYLSSYRQGVWNLATAPGGSCERACCVMPGGEFNIPGVWNERTGVCAWEADVLQLRACENWCYKEISRAGEIAKADRLERIEELDQQGVPPDSSENAYRRDGVIETRENMGTKLLYIVDMMVPVIIGKDPSLVQTLELGFGRGGEDPNVIGIYISPKRVKTSGWKYMRCHDVGLWVGDDWSVGGAKGSDGSWLRFESVHDGSVLDDGETFEMVSISVDAATVREWALADDSGGQICLDKFSISPGQKARIIEFLDTPG